MTHCNITNEVFDAKVVWNYNYLDLLPKCQIDI